MERADDPRSDLFRQCTPMTYWLGKRFAWKTGISVHELTLEAQGALGILLCGSGWKSYQAEKSKVTTWIYNKLSWHLKEYARTRLQEVERFVPLEVEMNIPAEAGWLERMWSELEVEGRHLLKIILEAPGALEDELWEYRGGWGNRRLVPRKRGKARRIAVESYLREEVWWPEDLIQRAFAQLEEQCR